MDSNSRQEYVRAAVSFLQNPKLVDSTLKDKLKFLRDKGLSDLEVDEALNLALVPKNRSQGDKWNFLLILGLCFGGYKLYQAYLEQRATKAEGEQAKRDSRQTQDGDRLLANDTRDHGGITDRSQPTLTEIMQKMSELKKLIELQRTNFGTEMQSLKTLLLGHEKFAAPPKIPEWQLPSIDEESTRTEPEVDAKPKPKPESNEKNNGVGKRKKNKTDGPKASSTNNGIIEPTLLADPNPV